MSDSPDWSKGVTFLPGAQVTLSAQDFPDWTDGVVPIQGPILPHQDFPDWTKAVGQVSGVFSGPPSIATLSAWYDANGFTGLADGAHLTIWPDLTANGNDLTVITIGGAPPFPTYYKTTPANLINGLPAVWFPRVASYSASISSSPNYILTNSSGSFTAFTVFLVNTFYPGQRSSIFGQNTGNNGFRPTFCTVNSTTFLPGASIDTARDASSTVSTGAAHVLVSQGNAGANSWLVQLDGSATTGTLTSALATAASQIFIGSTTSGSYFDGAVGECFVYSSALSSGQIATVLAYLRGKWGTP